MRYRHIHAVIVVSERRHDWETAIVPSHGTPGTIRFPSVRAMRYLVPDACPVNRDLARDMRGSNCFL